VTETEKACYDCIQQQRQAWQFKRIENIL